MTIRQLVARIDQHYKHIGETPWAWWGTGDKDNGWQVGLMVDEAGNFLGGEIEDPDSTEFIESICENEGSTSSSTLAHPALIAELVNNWPAIRKALLT